jgi:quinol monooxygenase YgiN
MIKFRVARSQDRTGAPGPIGVVAFAKAKAGAEDRVRTEALALVDPSRAEPGNISYDLHQGIDDQTVFLFYENWASADAFNSHRESPHFEKFLSATKDLLDEELELTRLNRISEPSERERYKNALTRVPKTAEFNPYRDAEADKPKSDLMHRASAALGRVVDTHPDRDKGLRPDDLYNTVMEEEQGLRKSWEEAFGGEKGGRDLFGLVAWTHFYDDKTTTWLATPADTPGLGKLGWTYLAERKRVPAEGLARSAELAKQFQPKYRRSQCVKWDRDEDSMYGRVMDGPRDFAGPAPEKRYLVRFRPQLGVPKDERWIVDYNLVEADDNSCLGIDPDP